ncbi:hypothetical protein ABN306_18290 [Providencia huaxiensis]|uniref:DUF596 domain-containing protein n=1 Tax=Providencia huaxiensis TaxID=2027290 RepID=A0A8I2AQL1_9GAMM|nr:MULTISPECIES: hypothetical protein [Providencia]ELR5076027.1 hypothetical protein [Providencia stuartii]ELR5071981.1 hypothetical protein [Providencia rettgeri]ELR5222712.1 hypothetical protein [Providencia rettgeri]MBN6361128.1 hypothetical protein [Providencia huaxiensis]MBQ0269141.1 hypothetical protein [Providencia huaxiensis]
MEKTLHFDEIIGDAKGLWLSGLFGSIVSWNPNKCFYEHRGIFFSMIKELLEKQIIRFCSPDDPLGKNIPYWNANSQEIVNHLEQYWPENAKAEDDDDLNFYFYEMPAILWMDGSGKYVGS